MLRTVRIVTPVDLDRNKLQGSFRTGFHTFRITAAAGADLGLALYGIKGYPASELLFTNFQAAAAVVDAQALVPVHGHIAHAGIAFPALPLFYPVESAGRADRFTGMLFTAFRPLDQFAVLADIDKIHELKAHGPYPGKLQVDGVAGLFRRNLLHKLISAGHGTGHASCTPGRIPQDRMAGFAFRVIGFFRG